ncbi:MULTISPECIES: S-methyl-5'-thioadenosine phosphorylase [unclassified Mumia]|uniref:S-methyl-5'-thioadenosine phosphorylase n=1 Tax=unclassified Mumia TaxID=2621872 RepID=UPI0027E346AB|nr:MULTISPECIES: S-methyl-5'-thioadenosine phosphorylase [unclassified Mumia]
MLADSAGMDAPLTPEVAVIGGTGFYTFLDDVHEVDVDTPYGLPSGPIALGTVPTEDGPRAVAFLPRHGPGHRYPAHAVPYRANLWALRSLGVRQVLAPCAVGGLQPELGPGTLVVPDQLVDRTTNRNQTFYHSGAVHIGFADPYCPRLRTALVDGAPGGAVDGGALVVIEGPRFSTRAESQWYSREGWSIIGMTGHPEAVLARELALCYATVALVTDLDAGVEAAEAVSHQEVLRVFGEHLDTLRDALRGVVGAVGSDRTCDCASALDGLDLPITLP